MLIMKKRKKLNLENMFADCYTYFQGGQYQLRQMMEVFFQFIITMLCRLIERRIFPFCRCYIQCLTHTMIVDDIFSNCTLSPFVNIICSDLPFPRLSMLYLVVILSPSLSLLHLAIAPCPRLCLYLVIRHLPVCRCYS